MYGYNLSVSLMCVLLFLETVFNVINIMLFCKSSDDKYFNHFTVSGICFSLSSFLFFILMKNKYKDFSSLNTNVKMIIALFIFSAVFLLLLFTINAVRNVKIKNGMHKKKIINDKLFISFLLVFTLLLNYFIAIPFPEMVTTSLRDTQSEIVMDYLTTKYGNLNFQIKNTYEEIDEAGISKFSSGTTFEITSDRLENSFKIIFSDTDIHQIHYDCFLTTYYAEKYGFIEDNEIQVYEFADFLKKDFLKNYPDFASWNYFKEPGFYIASDRIYKTNDIYTILEDRSITGDYNDIIPYSCGRIPLLEETEEMLYTFMMAKNTDYSIKYK